MCAIQKVSYSASNLDCQNLSVAKHHTMIVRVRNAESACDEWAVLEFQGEIIGDLHGDLGHITVTDKAAFMDIGQHTLEGDVVTLKSPFMVLEKEKGAGQQAVQGNLLGDQPTTTGSTINSDSNNSSSSNNNNNSEHEDGVKEAELSIRGFARLKIIFKQRPRPKRLEKK